MKAIALAAWIFVNVAFLAMCGFFYMLCIQLRYRSGHFRTVLKTYVNTRDFSRDHNIQYYSDPKEEASELSTSLNIPTFLDESHKNPMAGDHSSSNATVVGWTSKSKSDKMKRNDGRLVEKIAKHKSQLMIQLRRVLHDESSVFKSRGNGSNPYNVEYNGPREAYHKKSSRELVCALKKKGLVKMVKNQDEPFRSLGLGSHLPSKPMFDENAIYNSCAIVSSAGSLYGSELGRSIDKHQVVLRFNHAPTQGYEEDVGHKTTVRIVNSQVVTKPNFNFLESSMYRDIDILAWDPAKYNHSLEQWYTSPDFSLFQRFFEHRLLNPDTGLYLLNPNTLWNIWNYIQEHMPLRIRRNPPSSGFLGLALLLPHCAYVDMFEFIPSLRMTKRCHYYESAEDLSCTFGVWHPLSAEKMLMYAMNSVNDMTVFHDGYIRIPGYNTLKC